MCGRYVIYSADELIDLHDIVEEAQRRADAAQREAQGKAGASRSEAQGKASASRSEAQLQADFTDGKIQNQTSKLLKVKTGEIFPTNIAPILIPSTTNPTDLTLRRFESHPMIWGYPQFGSKKGVVINTRLETAGEKPFWRDSLMQRRCVVPSSGFFEWQHGGPFDKQRYLFDLPDEPILYLAGIYKAFPAADTALLERFSILTTAPNNSIRAVHDRMPVVLRSEELAEWLYGDPFAFIDRSGIELRQREV